MATLYSKLSASGILARAAVLALVLCLLPACEKPQQERAPGITRLSDLANANKKRDPKLDKKLDKSFDQVRNEAMEQINKQLKDQEANAKKNIAQSEKDARKKEQNKQDGPRMPKTFSTNNTPITEIDPGKRGKTPERSIPIPSGSANQPRYAEILGPGQKSPSSAGDTVNLSKADNKKSGSGQKEGAFNNSDMQIVNARGSAELGSEASSSKQKEPNFFQRMIGKKKPETPTIQEGPAGAQMELLNPRLKKDKAGQVFGEKPDGTQFGSMTNGSILGDETGKKNLKDIYNPYNTRGIPNRETFKQSSPERSALESDRVRNEMVRSRLESEAAGKKKFGDGTPSGEKSQGPRPITDFEPSPAAKVSAAAVAPAAAAVPAVVQAARKDNAPAALLTDETAPITANSPINNDQSNVIPGAAAKPISVQNDSPEAIKAQSAADEALADAQDQLGSLDEYHRGLKSRDVVAREASFQRAVFEKREDALHALAEEVRSSGLLAPRAARFLAAIGKTNDEVERALATGLNSNSAKDNQLREMCAGALGQLRVRRAVPLLIEKVKYDKTLQVRSASAAALGMIGDRSALPALRMKLDDPGEIEFVKQSAALALARFGDPAGRDHLLQSLDSQNPAYQVLGMTGLAQLNDPNCAAYLGSFLDSRYPEVWTTAVALFPRIGARNAVPLLREQLLSNNESSRIRAALALGFLGCTDGLPLICRAVRSGDLQERAMGCDLLGRLNRTEQIPLLIEKLNDPHTNIRQTAATALTQLNATAAIPAISEAARGRLQNSQLPPALRGGQQDIYERAIMLACLRILRGEKDDLVLTLPTGHDSRWPEFDRELVKEQLDMLKMYKLVEVVPSGAGSAGALLQVPGGQEVLYRKGEIVAAGFKVTDVSQGASTPDGRAKVPPFVTLMRGDQRIILYEGQSAEVENVRDARQK